MPQHTLLTLRDSLSSDQRAVLDDVWNHFANTGEFIPTALLRYTHRRAKLEPILSDLGGRVVTEGLNDGTQRYIPTLLGALVTSLGADLEQLLACLLAYVLQRYETDPQIRTISDKDVATGCDLDPERLTRLHRLISLYDPHLVVSTGGRNADGSWFLSIHEHVDMLREYPDIPTYIQETVARDYDPTYPVGENDRMTLSMASNRIPFGHLDGIPEPQPAPPPTVDAVFAAPLDVAYIADPALRQIIISDWSEVGRVASIGALKSCVLLCGSVVEGLLLALVRSASAEEVASARRNTRCEKGPLESLGLYELQTICDELKLSPRDGGLLSAFVRTHRNLIHPGRHARDDHVVDAAVASVAAQVVASIARQAAKTLATRTPGQDP